MKDTRELAIDVNRKRFSRLVAEASKLQEQLQAVKDRLSEVQDGIEDAKLIATALNDDEFESEYSVIEDIEDLLDSDEDIPQTISDFAIEEARVHSKAILKADDVLTWMEEKGYRSSAGTLPNRNTVLVTLNRDLEKAGRGRYRPKKKEATT